MKTDNIIRRIHDGDTRALDKVYFDLKPAFVSYFQMQFNTTLDTALDLYQESMAAVYNNITTGRLTSENLKDAKLSTYVTQVGKYIHMSHLRKREPEFVFSTEQVLSLGDNLPDDEDKGKEEKLFIVRKTVKDMPYPCSKVLNLFFFHQKSGKEIADIMEYSSPDVVKTQVYKCKQKLREQLVKRLNLCGYDEFK